MQYAEDLVLSELHVGSCLIGSQTCCTRFTFASLSSVDPSSPPAAEEYDSDGDLVTPRPLREFVSIQHSQATPLERCGEQVWRGSCILADLILSHEDSFSQACVLELGAGVGLASLFLAKAGSRAIITDVEPNALGLVAKNVSSNKRILPGSLEPKADAITPDPLLLRRLDWLNFLHVDPLQLTDVEMLQLLNGGVSASPTAAAAAPASPLQPGHVPAEPAATTLAAATQASNSAASSSSTDYQWIAEDLNLLADVSIVLAGDVVYDETLTDAFMHAAHALMTWMQHRRQAAAAAAAGSKPAPRLPAAVTAGHTPAAAGSGTAMLRHPGAAGVGESVPTAAAAAGLQAAVPVSRFPLQHHQQHQQWQEQGVREHHQEQESEPPPSSVVLLVSLEKRFNFTLRDMEERAPAFEHFLTYIDQQGQQQQQQEAEHQQQEAEQHQQQQEAEQQKSLQQQQQQEPEGQPLQGEGQQQQQLEATYQVKPLFKGQRIPLEDIEQVCIQAVDCLYNGMVWCGMEI
jgi:predicted nicotinamide N-methyase